MINDFLLSAAIVVALVFIVSLGFQPPHPQRRVTKREIYYNYEDGAEYRELAEGKVVETRDGFGHRFYDREPAPDSGMQAKAHFGGKYNTNQSGGYEDGEGKSETE